MFRIQTYVQNTNLSLEYKSILRKQIYRQNTNLSSE